ncbi:hypothetical protein OMW55_09620 [Sphingomonas sp. BN140010]|uniref:HTH luxR-type domain-containing protein n=1 Tax=Sphingomonas arvum TaxID=2992113 RepID=A0ABT3JG53_9SPHN|nr:hypothetical protein [Sphingomonas sp. BN140010]MCW3798060.1 hypothetical protein [Sphingomonas sp. BN140010]
MEELLPLLYTGITSERAWQTALDIIAARFTGAAIYLGTFETGGACSMESHGIDPACAVLISGPLATFEANPLLRPMLSVPDKRAMLTAQMCGDRALVRSRVYEEALRPHGHRYTLGAVLDRSARQVSTIALTRPKGSGDFDGRDAATLDRLLPHLARAYALRRQFGAERTRNEHALGSFQQAGRATIVLSKTARILLLNAAARHLLAECDGLDERCGRLVLADRRSREAFQGKLGQVGTDGSSSAPRSLAIARPSGRAAYAASLAPLASSRGGVAVVLTVLDRAVMPTPTQERLHQLYGLTPSEAHLARQLCEHDLKQAADELCITLNTAKSHLKSIFDKVGVHRQAALVRQLTCDGMI